MTAMISETSMQRLGKIDLHMHTTISDGTDSPQEILENVKAAGICLFSVTDHDAIKGSLQVVELLQDGDTGFITGVEFSCKDENGKYHILGYGYDSERKGIQDVVDLGHRYRMEKVQARLDFIKAEFGFSFSDEDLEKLLSLDNPGKPHIGNLMVQYGYVKTKEDAIRYYIDQLHFQNSYVRPEEAIRGILASGGIPVLAHPSYGRGDELILGDEMDKRLKHLMGYGLQGVEAFYSGFTPKLQEEMLGFAKRYELYVTAGSDYHGTNKLIALGDTGFMDEFVPDGIARFLADVRKL